jgi:predicted enzyme related to lactoylglutathione lyase
MGERTEYEPGTFCLVGLATPDPAAAKAFYASLFGWRAHELSAGEAGTYTMLGRDSESVAILYGQREAARTSGAPPHWTSYISVEDADAMAAQAVELGATVVGEPLDVADAGRVAAIRDPVGAIVSLWEPRSLIGATLVNDVGALCWNELATPDPDAAAKFYGELFGWGFEPIETGPGGPEMMGITNAAGSKNGSTTKQDEDAPGIPPSWMPYFGVESCPDAVALARELDGQVVVDTLEIPTGRLAVLRDRQSAAFGILDGEMDP